MDVPPDLRITITDCRRVGFCASGIKRWFEAQGFDFRNFLKNGIDADTFLATGDGQANQVVRAKLKALGHG
jgi:hypothetical protein